MAALQARTAGGGGPGGMPQGGGPAAAAGDGQDPAAQYAQQVSELKGADPGMLLRQIKTMRQLVGVLLVQNMDRLPNVAGKLSKLIAPFDAVLKEIQQAGNVDAAVRNPIGMGSANPPQVGSGSPASSGGMQ